MIYKLNNVCEQPLNLTGFSIESKFQLRDLQATASSGEIVIVKAKPTSSRVFDGRFYYEVKSVVEYGVNWRLTLNKPITTKQLFEQVERPILYQQNGSWWLKASVGLFVLKHPKFGVVGEIELR